MSEKATIPPQEGLFNEELSSEEPKSPETKELDAPLAEAAKQAKKAVENARRGNDAVSANKKENLLYLSHTATANAGGFLSVVGGALSGNYGTVLSAAIFIGYMGYKEIYQSTDRPVRKDRIQLPYHGYGLQCFNARAPEGGCQEGEVAMLVLPRIYEKGEHETAALACKRLNDVAKVAKIAQPDKMIVPSFILENAGAPMTGNRPLKNTVDKIAEGDLDLNPALSTLVVETATFIKMVESLHVSGDAMQARVMKALHQRYPHIETFSTPNDAAFKALERSMKSLTERAVGGELPGAIRVREQQNEQTITVRKALPPPEIRLTDDDVLVTQRDDKHQVLEALSLATIGQELRADENFMQKLSLGREGFSDLQLIAIAADTRRQRKRQQGTTLPSEHKETAPIPLGEASTFISSTASGREKGQEVIRYQTRIIGFGAVAVGAAIAMNPFLSISKPPSSPPLPPLIAQQAPHQNEMSAIGFAEGLTSGKASPEWKVVPFNTDGSGYYATDFNYSLDLKKGGWTGEMQKDEAFSMPTGLDNPNEPHITLSRPLDGAPVYDLPYKVGTRIAAARVRSTTGNIVPISLIASGDGMTSFIPGEQRHGDWLEYDLVDITSPAALPMYPITTGDLLVNPPQELAKQVRADAPEAIAQTFQNRYWYDNSPKLEAFRRQTTTKGYIKTLEATQECNCNICATGAAIVHHAAHPADHMAYTTGFLNTQSGKTVLHARHAWLTNSQGFVNDATPARLSPVFAKQQQEVSETDEQRALLQKWEQKAQQITTPPAPAPSPEQAPIDWVTALGALSAAALGGLMVAESQSGIGRRSIKALRRRISEQSFTPAISDEEVYSLFNWSLYGKPAIGSQTGSTLPSLTEFTEKTKPELLPTNALVQIAQEGLLVPQEYFTSQGIDPEKAQATLRRKARELLAQRTEK